MFGCFKNPHLKPEPLHRGLNYAIKRLCASALPTGYTVAENVHSVPRSLKDIQGAWSIVVPDYADVPNVYNDAETTEAAHAWLNYTHKRYGLPMSIAGKAAAVFVQCFHLLQEYGHDNETQEWVQILLCDVIANAWAFAVTGVLPIAGPVDEQYARLALRVCVELSTEDATDAGAILLAETIFGRA